jgi:hypothetical protein
MRALPRADIAANVAQTRAKVARLKPLGELPVNKVASLGDSDGRKLKTASKVASLKPPGDSESRQATLKTVSKVASLDDS